MTEAQHDDALRTLEQVFGDRVKRDPVHGEGLGTEDALASVLPMNAEEVRFLAEVAQRFSLPLVALGGGTIADAATKKGSVLIRFDLMRRTRIPDGEESWVETEPGISWLQLDDELRLLGKGLTVYPTSAPRATVGGWLTTDGLGVGSFEYGWLSENVLSASVVLPGGELVEVVGEEVRSFVGAEGKGIVVGATLRTRRADADVPFGVAFGSVGELTRAVAGVVEVGLPLWQLAFVDPGMTHARNLEERFMLFGVYPAYRGERVERGLDDVLASCQGRLLPAVEAYRTWGERFFPATPSSLPTPFPGLSRELKSLVDLPEKLSGVEERPGHAAVQGTVAKSGEVLLLILDADKNG